MERKKVVPLTIPNLLTLARIATIPIFVVVYFLQPEEAWFAAAIFVLAALTDWLDGFLARQMEVVSSFGAFLDPVADKLMVCTALVLLVADDSVTENVLLKSTFVVSIIVIVGREVSVVALREWMAEMGKRANIASSILSKIKTFAQMTAIVLLLYGQPMAEVSTLILGEVLLYVATVLTIWSMIVYLRIAWPTLTITDDF